mmetsp:Transcript_117008/g.372445  ORF Transcript_117008/g.372445 Transcript_117008/m.372445 type:complete len:604 (+) Transcript_117008:390-2201(+)
MPPWSTPSCRCEAGCPRSSQTWADAVLGNGTKFEMRMEAPALARRAFKALVEPARQATVVEEVTALQPLNRRIGILPEVRQADRARCFRPGVCAMLHCRATGDRRAPIPELRCGPLLVEVAGQHQLRGGRRGGAEPERLGAEGRAGDQHTVRLEAQRRRPCLDGPSLARRFGSGRRWRSRGAERRQQRSEERHLVVACDPIAIWISDLQRGIFPKVRPPDRHLQAERCSCCNLPHRRRRPCHLARRGAGLAEPGLPIVDRDRDASAPREVADGLEVAGPVPGGEAAADPRRQRQRPRPLRQPIRKLLEALPEPSQTLLTRVVDTREASKALSVRRPRDQPGVRHRPARAELAVEVRDPTMERNPPRSVDGPSSLPPLPIDVRLGVPLEDSRGDPLGWPAQHTTTLVRDDRFRGVQDVACHSDHCLRTLRRVLRPASRPRLLRCRRRRGRRRRKWAGGRPRRPRRASPAPLGVVGLGAGGVVDASGSDNRGALPSAAPPRSTATAAACAGARLAATGASTGLARRPGVTTTGVGSGGAGTAAAAEERGRPRLAEQRDGPAQRLGGRAQGHLVHEETGQDLLAFREHPCVGMPSWHAPLHAVELV